jgi:hypothetical protein
MTMNIQPSEIRALEDHEIDLIVGGGFFSSTPEYNAAATVGAAYVALCAFPAFGLIAVATYTEATYASLAITGHGTGLLT